MANDPYNNHADAIAQVDATIRNETLADTVSTDDVSDAVVKTNAMLDAIERRQTDGTVTYHAPAARTAAAWFTLLEAQLEGAASGDTFSLPNVLFKPGDTDANYIEVAVTNVTIWGNGCTMKRGLITPTAGASGGDSCLFRNGAAAGGMKVHDVVFDGDGTALAMTGRGDTVYLASPATFSSCRFVDPLRDDACYSLEMIGQGGRDHFHLNDCEFVGSGYGTWYLGQGSITMRGGTIDIPVDRNPTYTAVTGENPVQRLFQASPKTDKEIRNVLIDGVVCTIAARIVPENIDMGYFNFSGDDLGGTGGACETAIMRDCVIQYAEDGLPQICKIERVDTCVFERVIVMSLSEIAATMHKISTDNECGIFHLTDCYLDCWLSVNNGTLRKLLVENSKLGKDSDGNGVIIGNVHRILHVEIRNSSLYGMRDHILHTAEADSSSWADWDREATATLVNVKYKFVAPGSNYVMTNVNRFGYLRCTGLCDESVTTTPDRYTGAKISNSYSRRLMGTVEPGTPRTAYLGRRMDWPGVMAPLANTGTDDTTHPLPDTGGGDAFPTVTALDVPQQGNRIANDYYQTATYPTITNIRGWINDGAIWVPEP